MHFIVSLTHLLFVKHCDFKEADSERFASIVSRFPHLSTLLLVFSKEVLIPKRRGGKSSSVLVPLEAADERGGAGGILLVVTRALSN